MGLIGKIKDAPQGYAGFFDAVKVDQEKLEALYKFDYSMMGHGEEIAVNVQTLADAVENDGDIKQSIKALDKSIKAANEAFASRNEIISGMA